MRKLIKDGGRKAGKTFKQLSSIDFGVGPSINVYAVFDNGVLVHETVIAPGAFRGSLKNRESWQDAVAVEPLALPATNVTATRKRTRLKAIKVFST